MLAGFHLYVPHDFTSYISRERLAAMLELKDLGARATLSIQSPGKASGLLPSTPVRCKRNEDNVESYNTVQ